MQVYGGHDTSTVVRPHRRLVGFARVEVPPGQVATVDVALDLDQLRIRSEGSWRVESGVQQLDVGLHANDPHRVDLEPDLTIIDGRVRPVSTRR
ncbi:MAG TPA: fibronectin type III-like domain-contianing protein [Microthrixaceae bacterium]|nr:fibronectin type III-like domain-contianing protein [Microthrixaceae bacterium]